MTYRDKEIKTIINEIKENRLYLPAIQRKLVWKPEQVEKLFDSIMRGYPIGTFLFWKLKGKSINNYTFYKFIQEFKEGRTKNEIAPSPETKEEIIGVLDGQQRLNSMYIALQGSYAYKKPYFRWDNPKAFPKRNFYLNLLYFKEKADDTIEFYRCQSCKYQFVPPEAIKCPKCGIRFADDDSDIKFEFKFLTNDEASKIDMSHFWFSIKEVLLWKDITSAEEYYDTLSLKFPPYKEIFEDKDKKRLIKNNLVLLWQRLVNDKIISYYEVEEQELDKIVDIFIRVNSGGTILSKTDLLFSTIVAHWEEAREEVENLLESINSKGDTFNFNNDFIMRVCLVLTDCSVLFKVQTFRKENIKKIKDDWEEIKEALDKTVDLLVEFGFNRDNLTSHMSIIPIAYFFLKKGKEYKIDEKNKNLIRYYLIVSLLKQIYGGQGDQVLSKIRDSMRKEVVIEDKMSWTLNSKDFPLEVCA